MEDNPLTLRQSNPLRPPDWRYQLALRLVQEARHLSRRHFDPATRAIAEQLGARGRNGPSAAGRVRVDADFNLAMQVHRTPPLRGVVEALILADQQPSSIAGYVGTSASAIAWYETAFFDVRDRLPAAAFIVHHVIVGTAAPSDSDPSAKVWKLAAYLGGARVLQELLGIQKVDGLEPLLASQRQQIRAALQQQLLTAASVLAANNPVAAAHLLKIVDGGKAKAHIELSLSNYEQNAQEMLESLHFWVGDRKPDDMSPLREFDQCAAELRASEQMRVAAGESLSHGEALKSMTLLPPRPKTSGG